MWEETWELGELLLDAGACSESRWGHALGVVGKRLWALRRMDRERGYGLEEGRWDCEWFELEMWLVCLDGGDLV